MYCPETVLMSGGRVYICRHESADHYQGTPLLEKINPLRYQVCIGKGPGRYRWRWNDNAHLWRKWCNFSFRIRQSMKS